MMTLDERTEALARGDVSEPDREAAQAELRGVLVSLTRHEAWTRVLCRLLKTEREARKQAEHDRDAANRRVEALQGDLRRVAGELREIRAMQDGATSPRSV